jgi:hypothetical protein
MARPRVFVSSTYYDLKHIRASLENFIESLGFDPILFEQGDIAYTHDVPLDESCYREVNAADIFVLLVGGRYGSRASDDDRKPPESFFEQYNSVTKKELDAAIRHDIPVYVLVDSAVNAEYRTYVKNKGNDKIHYAHVDSVNVFVLLEQIHAQRRNNPIHTFERFADIENWLREQWAGLFREHLQRKSKQQPLEALSRQVEMLQAVSDTLKRYMEVVVEKVSPEKSEEVFAEATARFEEQRQLKKFGENDWVHYVRVRTGLDLAAIRKAMEDATSFDNCCDLICAAGVPESDVVFLRQALIRDPAMRVCFNEALDVLGKKGFSFRKSSLVMDDPDADQ